MGLFLSPSGRAFPIVFHLDHVHGRLSSDEDVAEVGSQRPEHHVCHDVLEDVFGEGLSLKCEGTLPIALDGESQGEEHVSQRHEVFPHVPLASCDADSHGHSTKHRRQCHGFLQCVGVGHTGVWCQAHLWFPHVLSCVVRSSYTSFFHSSSHRWLVLRAMHKHVV